MHGLPKPAPTARGAAALLALLATIVVANLLFHVNVEPPASGPRFSEQGSETVPANCVLREGGGMYGRNDTSDAPPADTVAQCQINQPKWI